MQLECQVSDMTSPSSFLSLCQGGERGANGGEGKGFPGLMEEIFKGRRPLIYGKETRASYREIASTEGAQVCFVFLAIAIS